MDTLINKYKPYFINDFHMNEEFFTILKVLINIDDLNILLIGGQSSGKTSFLYALIREYYGLNKNSPLPETNIMFINNLKEQGIHFYRNEMKTFCQSHASIYGKKKMVIIDDMDTINEQCQQVFRNYIDKYKHNVNFISTCSNIQKIIESIQSRTHILKINPLSNTKIKYVMENIIKNENIKADENIKYYILNISENSIRNVINNLEKLYIIDTELSLDTFKKMCSNISFQQFQDYIFAFKAAKNSLTTPINILYDIYDYGYSVIDILDYFFIFIKNTTLLNENQKYKIIPIICKYITIFHNIHENVIELALFTNEIHDIIIGI
jgi:DNA polymerase III delta prime subunit